MNVLTGSTRKASFVHELKLRNWGRIFVFDCPCPYDSEPWGFDNGAFVFWRKKLPFDDDGYARRLERAYAVGVPYMAVLPDKVAAGVQSLDMSLSWLDRVPREWPWYLAVQDGMMFQDVQQALCPGIVGMFLGGSNAFKVQAKDWCDFAHRNGLKFHYARAGVEDKILHALRVGSDSLDSAFPLWTVERFSEFCFLIDSGQSRAARAGQQVLFDCESAV